MTLYDMKKKASISITISQDLLDWVNEELKTARFASVSHAVEYALRRLKNQTGNEVSLKDRTERK